MGTVALDLTTTLQDLSGIGQGRQVCVAGADPSFSFRVEVAESTTATAVSTLANVNTTNGGVVRSFPADASAAMRYTVLSGSLGTGKIWVQGEENSSSVLQLSTSLQDVSEFATGRTITVADADSSLSVAIEEADSTGSSEVVQLAIINGSRSMVFSSDSSVAMRYRVLSGSVGTSTRIWISGQLAGSSGGGGIGPDLTTQLAWFIDPVNGSDLNDGKTLPTALKTLTAWFQKSCANGYYAFNTAGVTVTIESDLLSTDIPSGTVYVGSGGTLKFQGVPKNVTPAGAGVGANVTVTAANHGANTACLLADTGLASFSAYVAAGYIPYRLRTTSGSNPGAEFWVLKATAAHTARISAQMVPDPSLGPFGQTEVTITSGDAYRIEQLPAIPEFNLRFQVVPVSGVTEAVQFGNLAFSSGTDINIQNNDNGAGLQVGFYGCSFATCGSIEGGDFIDCRFAADSIVTGRCLVLAGMSAGDFISAGLPGSCFVDQNFAVQDGALKIYSAGGIIGQVQVWDAVNGGAIIAEQGGNTIILSYLGGSKLAWGLSSGIVNFFRVEGQGAIQYQTNTTGLTGLGSVGAADACVIGAGSGTNKAYAALPYVDANSFAGMFAL